MDSIAPISARFREALKRAEISRSDDVAKMGDSTRSVWDVEGHEDSICSAYSVAEVQGFCTALGIRPSELIGFKSPSVPLSNQELASRIREHCRSRNITF